MLTDRHFPYSSMQEINLDWILTKVKNILRFVPDDGAVGQILRRTAHGAEWSDEQGGGGGAVSSVNGQTGAVVLTASDVGALPDTYAAPVDSVNGQTGAVVLSIPSDTSDLTNGAGYVDAAGAAAAAPVQSVNGQTGAVSLSIPSDTADLTNTAGFVDAAGAAAAAPVQSVNGQTGAVVVPTIYIPTYTQLTEIYNHTGVVDTTVTIPTDGWYLIDLIGAWSATFVYVGTTNIAKAQITASNVTMSTVGLYLFGAGTVLSIKINASNGRVIISKTE